MQRVVRLLGESSSDNLNGIKRLDDIPIPKTIELTLHLQPNGIIADYSPELDVLFVRSASPGKCQVCGASTSELYLLTDGLNTSLMVCKACKDRREVKVGPKETK